MLYGSEYLATITLLVLVVYIIIFFVLVMGTLFEIAKEKGYTNLGAQLIWIGVLGTPIISAIIVAALPDKKLRSLLEKNQASQPFDELPPV